MAPEVCTPQTDGQENNNPLSTGLTTCNGTGPRNKDDSPQEFLRDEDILAVHGLTTDDAIFSNSASSSEAPYLENRVSESVANYELTNNDAAQCIFPILKNENISPVENDLDLNRNELAKNKKSDLSNFLDNSNASLSNQLPSEGTYSRKRMLSNDNVIEPAVIDESANASSLLPSRSGDASILKKDSKENKCAKKSSFQPSLSQNNLKSPGISNHKIEPLVLDMPNLKMAHVENNSKLAQLSGVQYKSNLCSMMPKIQNLKSVLPKTEIDGVVVTNSQNTTFGTKIETPGDVIVNQYVDLGKDFSPDTNGVIITDSSHPENCCSKMKYLWMAMIVGTILTTTLTTAALVVLKENKEELGGDVSQDPGNDAPANYSLRLLTRAQWSSHTDVRIPDLAFNPARYIIVSHTTGPFCNRTPICENIVRGVESWHVQIGYSAIGYNFLIGGDGYIYEGRGWGKEGAHTYGFNCASVGVAFLGNFDRMDLTPSMIKAFDILVEEGLRRGALGSDYKLFGQYQFKATASPGLNVKEVIKSWPHWTGQVTQQDKLCK